MNVLTTRNALVPVVFASLLLVATWRYHIPLMLWDHLDLVPLYEAWRQGGAVAELWRIHDGSHLHTAAYAVLLVTTHLSNGQPLFDCLVSWALLVTQAVLLLRIASRTLAGFREQLGIRLAVAFFALYPGHLANLQWGWQVAVFISTLFGAVIPVYVLTRERIGLGSSILGAASAVIGVMGFSTALAMFPVAIMLVATHREIPAIRRLVLAAPWLLAMAALAAWLGGAATASEHAYTAVGLAVYVLNYLGSGVLRFAENLAPFWAAMGIVTGVAAMWRARGVRSTYPWLALMLFSMGCAALTALGRVGPFGVDHAFVTRYVSFSSLFWLGWLGLALVALQHHAGGKGWWRAVIGLTLLLAVANAVHLTKKAAVVRERSMSYARHFVDEYPRYDRTVLGDAYGDRSGFAPERLERLRARGFAPFHQVPDAR